MNLRALDQVGTEVSLGPFDEVLSGDERALRAFFTVYRPVIEREIRRVLFGPRGLHGRLVSQDDVGELRQRTFEVLFRDRAERLRRYDAGHGMSAQGWIALCARQQATNYLDSRHALRHGALREVKAADPEADPIDRAPSAEADPEQALAAREVGRALIDALQAELSLKERQAFNLLIVGELEISEVCALMNITQADAYQLRHRIREKARRILHRQEVPR